MVPSLVRVPYAKSLNCIGLDGGVQDYKNYLQKSVDTAAKNLYNYIHSHSFCDSLPSGCYKTMSLHRLLKRKDTDR